MEKGKQAAGPERGACAGIAAAMPSASQPVVSGAGLRAREWPSGWKAGRRAFP